MAQATPDEHLELLARLSQKPGVQSTLVLARETGAIVRTSGLISNSTSANPNATLPASHDNAAEGNANGTQEEEGINSAENVARLVWNFVGAADTLASGLQKDDEPKLLRVRTRKNELVIVPDAKFLLVVIHETPPA